MTLGGVDDWLKSEVRRAERQGLLRGRHLSPVQFKATIVLEYLDNIDRSERERDDILRALLASGDYKPHRLFPNFFETPKDDGDEVVDAPDAPLTGNVDYSDVSWQSPTENMAEFERLMGEVAKLQHGKMSGDQLAERPDDGWR